MAIQLKFGMTLGYRHYQSSFIKTPIYSQLRHITPISLMNLDHTSWDDDTLNDLFCNRDKLLIRQLPLPLTCSQEYIFWSGEVTGFYSVKNAKNSCWVSVLLLVGKNGLLCEIICFLQKSNDSFGICIPLPCLPKIY